MYQEYDRLMECYALLMATLTMPYVSEDVRISGALELTRLQGEMESELVTLMVVVTG